MIKKIIYFIVFLSITNLIEAQTECDNITLQTYGNPVVVARSTIKFKNGYKTTGVNGDLHAYIDPFAACNGWPGGIALNYVRTYSPIKNNATNQVPEHENLNYNLWQENVQYFDGLGRLIQTIDTKVSPTGKDVITPVEYDQYGRQVNDYLPYYISQTENPGEFQYNGVENQINFYDEFFNDGINAKSEKQFENSPLNRVLSQSAPGQDWQLSSGHTVDYQYSSNSVDEVKRWEIADNGNLSGGPFHYYANELYKIITTDENENEVIVFKDKQNKVIMTESKVDENWLKTYYVYDDFGLLRYVIPPLASIAYLNGSYITNQNINKLCYYYQYDARKRMTIKKLPGAEPIFMIYNKRDMLVLVQDGNLRVGNNWLFTKYDAFDRPVITGKYHNTQYIGQVNMQTYVDGFSSYPFWENYNTTSNAYSNSAFPIINSQTCTVYSETYYDSYDYSESLGANYAYSNHYGIPKSTKVKGLVTASKTLVLDGGNTYLVTVNWYDEYGRVLETVGKNHLGGYDRISNKYNFTGELLETYQTHNSTGVPADNHEIGKVFAYDRMSRLLRVTETPEGLPSKITTANEYNEFGQIIKKKLYNTGDSAYLQQIDYSYNIRGWMTMMNDPNSLGDDYFAMRLYYNDGATYPQYNGNISKMTWASDNFQSPKVYNFEYDGVNRIKQSVYSDTENRDYSTTYSYDLNGNIRSLSRRGKGEVGYLPIDYLCYTYTSNTGITGNQLLAVDDSDFYDLQTNGFTDNGSFYKVTGINEYAYDANGNLTKDDNKQISDIQYNHLNLPDHIEMFASANQGIFYVYDAAGIKLKKTFLNGEAGYIETDYSGSYIYENNILQYILTDYGKIIRNTDGSYTRHYNLTDHLGNVRATFDETGTVIQEDSYYPFGMTMNGLSYPLIPNEDKNLYLYNGKELDEDFGLNWYHYGFRMYDPQLGRFPSLDPKADEFAYVSPYNYAENSPIDGIDLWGLQYVRYDDLPSYAQEVYFEEGKQFVEYQNEMYLNIGEDLYMTSSGLSVFDEEGAVKMSRWIYNSVPQTMSKEDWVMYDPDMKVSGFGACGAAAANMVYNATGHYPGNYGMNKHYNLQMYTQHYPTVNSKTKANGLNTIHRSVENGDPIMLGVHYKDQFPNNLNGSTDLTTDHYVVAYNRGYDADGEFFYFADSPVANANIGMSELRKLYIQPDGTLRTINSNATYNASKAPFYIVTQVRPIK
jgi:RHS repeat-associated protein